MSDQLVLLDEARARLAKVASVDEAKQIRDKAAALEHYGRQQKLSLESVNSAGEIKVRAERRIGELLKAIPRVDPVEQRRAAGKAGGRGRPKASRAEHAPLMTPLADACARAAIAPTMARDCQKLAEIPAPVFEATIAVAKSDPDIKHRGISTDAMLRAHRDSDGSIESIKRAVNKEVAARPEARYSAVVGKFGRALVELEELSHERDFAKWVHSSKTETIALREAFKTARAIEKEIFA